MTGLRSKLTVQSRFQGNFPLWSGECVFLTALFSDRTLQMPTSLHQKQNVGNYFFVMKNHYTSHRDQAEPSLRTQTDATTHFLQKRWHFFLRFFIFLYSTLIRVGVMQCVSVCTRVWECSCAGLVNWTH